jgi:hypothetical protein
MIVLPMKAEVLLSGLPRPLIESRHIALRISKKRGRPESLYRLSIMCEEDVLIARRFKVPVYLLTPGLVTSLGYPVTFPDHLLLAREVSGAVDSRYPRVIFSSTESILLPRIEDIAVALLRVDPLAARGVILRNRASVDPLSLLRKVIQESVEREATWVNLQDVSPTIPSVGYRIDPELLRTQDALPEVIGLRA